jgi:serine/threonine-protein kinase
MNRSQTMELDEMKAAWQELNQRLETQTALNLHLFKEGKLDRMRRGLRPLVWGQSIQIVIGAGLALLGGGFWPGHLDTPHLWIAGVLLHLSGISMIALGAWMLAMISRIDYGAPLVAIQRQLTLMRKVYVRGGMLVGMQWWFLWIPLMIVLIGDAGVDLYKHAPGVVWYGCAVGIAGTLATWLFVRWSRTRPRLAQRLEEQAAGRGLVDAQRFLDEIAQFEQE